MKIQYDIAVPPVETPLSNNRLKVEYEYVYSDIFKLERDIKRCKKERRKGWKQYDSDSVVYYGIMTHLWKYTVYFKREKPIKRIKGTVTGIGQADS